MQLSNIHTSFSTYDARWTSSLSGVLHAGGDALHGQDKRVFQPRRVLARRVPFYKLCRLAGVCVLLGQMRSNGSWDP